VAVLPVFAEEERQTSPLLPPKGTDLPDSAAFPCKSPVFGGPPEGAKMAFLDPEPAAAVLMGEGHAPVVAVLVASARRARQPLASPSVCAASSASRSVIACAACVHQRTTTRFQRIEMSG